MIDHNLLDKIKYGVAHSSDERLFEVAKVVCDELEKRKSERDNINDLVKKLQDLESDW